MFWKMTPAYAADAVCHSINSRQLADITPEQRANIIVALRALWSCDAFHAVCKSWSDDQTAKFIALSLGRA